MKGFSMVATASAVMVLLLAAQATEGTISCSDVIVKLRPCVSYLVSGSGKPPPACCSGVSALASAASTSADKKAACGCIKSAASTINLNPQLTQSLPSNCGINLPFPVSPNTDCSKIG